MYRIRMRTSSYISSCESLSSAELGAVLFRLLSWRSRKEGREKLGVFLLLVVEKGSPTGFNTGRGVPEGSVGDLWGNAGGFLFELNIHNY